jgi:hypothetical protein
VTIRHPNPYLEGGSGPLAGLQPSIAPACPCERAGRHNCAECPQSPIGLACVCPEDPLGISPITTVGRYATVEEAQVATDEVWTARYRHA